MKKLSLLFPLITATNSHPQTLLEQGLEYQKNEQFKQATSCYKKIAHTDETYLSSLFNRGCCYLSVGKIEKALTCFNTILSISPNILPALYNTAYTLKTSGNIDAAIKLYKKIILMDNSYEPAHLALGFAYLINGDFENGWKYHERYLKKSGKNGERLRSLLSTNSIANKTVRLTPEGGLGDTLQFIRYAQKLHEMGAKVIACVQKPLLPLISLCPYIDTVITSHETLNVSFDAESTYMSLPAIFADTEKTFPHIIPYLYPDKQLVKQWKSFFAQDKQYKVGICWQADVHNDVSRMPIARRGCLLKHFALLQNVLNISIYSLQKYDGVEEIAEMPSDFPLHLFDNLDEESGPFMDTAAIIKNLDLVITVDTAVAHLAGALGCKVWLLLPYATDWRWINNRTDSPWYPTMRIFKQQVPFDWEGVMREVAKELSILVNTAK